MKRLMGNVIISMIKWAMGDNKVNQNEVFNSVRINALVSQLIRNGNIDKDKYESELAVNIYNLIGRNDINGRQNCQRV